MRPSSTLFWFSKEVKCQHCNISSREFFSFKTAVCEPTTVPRCRNSRDATFKDLGPHWTIKRSMAEICENITYKISGSIWAPPEQRCSIWAIPRQRCKILVPLFLRPDETTHHSRLFGLCRRPKTHPTTRPQRCSPLFQKRNWNERGILLLCGAGTQVQDNNAEIMVQHQDLFNQLLRACFKIMTCFNKSVILLEQGGDWYLHPKNWWELIFNSSERTSLSSTSPQHSHQQMATIQQLSDNGLTYRCVQIISNQPNSNTEVATHASNHPTQLTQQTAKRLWLRWIH